MRKPAMYEAARKISKIEESLIDEVGFVLPVLFACSEALQNSTVNIDEEVPNYTWGVGWIIERVREHLIKAIENHEQALKIQDENQKFFKNVVIETVPIEQVQGKK